MSLRQPPSLPRQGADLSRLARLAELRETVRREDLRPGDWLVVTTKNSRYVVGCEGPNRLRISGGWFDQTGETPADVEIRGCTFGGRAIWTEILAAPGLFLEFGNGVRTTRIQEVRTFHGTSDEAVC